MTQGEYLSGLQDENVHLSAQHAPLGAIAASGFAWNLVVSIITKIVGAVSQIALARLLIPEEFGAYAQATIVIVFAVIFRDWALPQLLINRQREFAKWANAAFWMSQALGIATGAIMAVAGMFLYKQGSQTVAGILWIAAAGSPFIAMSVVPVAALQIQLRFKLLAQIGAIGTLLSAALTVLMALLHFGAYSLIVPVVVIAAARSLFYFFIVKLPLRATPEWSKWRAMVVDSGFSILTALGFVIVGQGDYITLTWYYDKYVLGIYFFAFSIAIQTVVLMTSNLSQVLVPTLARLNDEKPRQIAAYLRSCQVLSATGIPLCALQLLLARPAIVAIFGAKWSDSVLFVQILSAGVAFALVNSLFGAVLQAQGRFRLMAFWTIFSTIVFLLLVQIGVRIGGPLGVATAVSVFHLVLGSIGMRLALSRWGTWKDIARVFVPILAACAVAGLPLLLLPIFAPTIYTGHRNLYITLTTLVGWVIFFLLLYAWALRRFAREVAIEIHVYFLKIFQPLRQALHAK